ncbi:MAG: amidohydrolase [Planctomycetes bacterium]|nr:amidohydrolase [Planctomycetota bacterium]
MNTKLVVVLICMLVLVCSCAGPQADLVLINGDIYTLEGDQPWACCVVITGDTITAVLNNKGDADKYIGPGTRIVDLKGNLVTPGFIDSHVHFAGFAAQQHDVMLMNVGDDAGLVKELRRVTALVGKDEWITGGDWEGALQWMEGQGEIELEEGVERWEPERGTIDEITRDNPCFLNSYDRQRYLANTVALQAAGLDDARLEGMKLDSEGKPTGLIYRGSPAIGRIRAVVKPKSEERILKEYRTGLQRFAEMGIVEMHDMIRSFDELERYIKLQENGELTCRVWVRCWLDLIEEVFERGYTMGAHPVTGKRDYYLRFGSFKSANDGMLGSRGAMLFEPYNDRPDYQGHYQEYNSDSDVPGSLVGNPEVYYNYCKDAYEHGFSVDSHAIGDRGISEVVDVLERIQKDLDADMSMFRVIHCEIPLDRELDRIKALNLIAETNPSQMPDDMRWIADRIGPEREQRAFPFRKIIDKGIMMNFGSDIPGNAGAIFFCHPRYVLNSAINRTNNNGEPEGGWLPQHKITPHEAMKAFSLYGAYGCMREDKIRGSIKPGKLADLSVSTVNFIENPEDLLDLDITMTIVGGKIVFEKAK